MKKQQSLGYTLGGVVVFLLRYAPVFKSEVFDYNYSLDEGIAYCNSIIGSFWDKCDWMEPLNVILIIVAVALIVYGVYLFSKK